MSPTLATMGTPFYTAPVFETALVIFAFAGVELSRSEPARVRVRHAAVASGVLMLYSAMSLTTYWGRYLNPGVVAMLPTAFGCAVAAAGWSERPRRLRPLTFTAAVMVFGLGVSLADRASGLFRGRLYVASMLTVLAALLVFGLVYGGRDRRGGRRRSDSGDPAESVT